MKALFEYLFALDAIKGRNLEKAFSYLTDITPDAMRLRKRLLFLNRGSVEKLLTSILYSEYREYALAKGTYIPDDNDLYINQSSRYFAACKHFMRRHKKRACKIEYAICKLAKDNNRPDIIFEFARACKSEIVAKCRLFNTLSRMKRRDCIPTLVNVLGKTEETITLSNY
jgi:hypothetical protein